MAKLPWILHRTWSLSRGRKLWSLEEFGLLQKLLENAWQVISREQLNQTLYGWGENIDSNALEAHIHNLRKRFGAKAYTHHSWCRLHDRKKFEWHHQSVRFYSSIYC